MLKDAGEEGVELARQLIEAVFSCSVITSDWEGSFILNLYKGKGEAPGRGNYRDLKRTDQVIKRHEQVLDSYIREMVNINEMQLGFVPGRGTTGAIVVVLQLEWAVRVIQVMYSNAQSRMQVNSQYNYEIGVGVNVHQDSALSPLLFIPVMEALSHEFISKLKAWKAGMENKELHVNMKKTKFLVSGVGCRQEIWQVPRCCLL